MRMFWEFCDFLYIAMIIWLIIRHAWSAILWHDRIQACDIYLQELTDCHQLWISIAPDEGVTLTWHRQPQYWHTFADRSSNILCLWLSKVSANAFSDWLRPCPEADRKWPRKTILHITQTTKCSLVSVFEVCLNVTQGNTSVDLINISSAVPYMYEGPEPRLYPSKYNLSQLWGKVTH